MKFFYPLKILFAWALCLGLLGCAAQPLDFSLVVSPEQGVDVPVDAVVGVDALVDLRPQVRGSDNKKWMGFIPGILWLEIPSNTPELYTAFSPYNSRAMNLALAESLKAYLSSSGAFKEVVYLPADPYQKVDYRLEGVLRRTLVEETGYYYGSGMYAWITRIFGFPYVSYRIALEADLRLRSMESGAIIWHGKIKGTREDKYHNVYSLARGRDGKHLIASDFCSILRDELPKLTVSMTQAVRMYMNGND